MIYQTSVSAIFAAMTAEFSQLHSPDLPELEKNVHLRMLKYKALALKEFSKCHVLAGWIRELFLGLLDRQFDDTAAPQTVTTQTQQLPDMQRIFASPETQNSIASKPGMFVAPEAAQASISDTRENNPPSDNVTMQGSTAESTSLPHIDLSSNCNWGLGQELEYLTADRIFDSEMNNMDRSLVGWPEFSNFGDGSGIDELYKHYCNQ